MDKILSQIDEIYSQILEIKSIIQEQSTKPHLFGGASCDATKGGPEKHAKLNRTEWFERNAWDVLGSQGTKVYSLENATVTSVNQKEYNKERGEYGWSIEMKTPTDKIYYTHLSSINPKLKQGLKVSQGDWIGVIGKPAEDPNWPTHVHIALERGDIRNLMDGYCNILVKKDSVGTAGGATSGDTGFFYDNEDFASMVLGDRAKLESEESKNVNLKEAVMMAPVPIKPGFEGNFEQNRGGYIHPGTDIPVPSGTPVKAPLSGKVVGVKSNQHPCGGTIDIQYSDGLWSRFCHMSQIKVKEGDLVNRGDVVGLSGGGKNDYGRGRSSGPHLHFTLKKNGKNVDPVHYMERLNVTDITFDKGLDNNISIGSEEGVDYSSGIQAISQSGIKPEKESGFFYGNKDWADLISKPLDPLKKDLEMKEEKIYGEFGKEQKSRYGTITLPKEKNEKIKSPVDGVVTKGKYNTSCKNQISISHDVDGETFTLEYCNVTQPKIRSGQRVSKGTVIGLTKEDVVISLYDDSGSRVYIDNYIKREIDKQKKLSSKGITSEPKFYYDNPWGKILGNILSTPLKWFEDKYDESGKLVQKRFSSPTEKIQPDDWISQGSPTYSKKLREQLEKIKKIL